MRGRAQDDSGLGVGGAGLAPQRPHGVIEVIGVYARDSELIIEWPGHEGDLTHRWEFGDGALKVVRVGAAAEPQVDERIEGTADGAEVDACCEAGYHFGGLKTPHSVGDGVWGETNLGSEACEGSSSVCDESVDDSEVSLIKYNGFHKIIRNSLRSRKRLSQIPVFRSR